MPPEVLILFICQWIFCSSRGWFSQGSSASITAPDFVAMEAGGDRLPSERWSFFGPKAIQKSTNDPGMSSEVCPARARGELLKSKTASYFSSPWECVLFISGPVPKAECEGDSFFALLLSWLPGGTRTGSVTPWCGLTFRWHEAGWHCVGFQQIWLSVVQCSVLVGVEKWHS